MSLDRVSVPDMKSRSGMHHAVMKLPSLFLCMRNRGRVKVTESRKLPAHGVEITRHSSDSCVVLVHRPLPPASQQASKSSAAYGDLR